MANTSGKCKEKQFQLFPKERKQQQNIYMLRFQHSHLVNFSQPKYKNRNHSVLGSIYLWWTKNQKTQLRSVCHAHTDNLVCKGCSSLLLPPAIALLCSWGTFAFLGNRHQPQLALGCQTDARNQMKAPGCLAGVWGKVSSLLGSWQGFSAPIRLAGATKVLHFTWPTSFRHLGISLKILCYCREPLQYDTVIHFWSLLFLPWHSTNFILHIYEKSISSATDVKSICCVWRLIHRGNSTM